MPSKKNKNGEAKKSVQRRTVNKASAKPGGGAPFNEQDVKRRLGQFTGAGEHARQGTRTKGPSRGQ